MAEGVPHGVQMTLPLGVTTSNTSPEDSFTVPKAAPSTSPGSNRGGDSGVIAAGPRDATSDPSAGTTNLPMGNVVKVDGPEGSIAGSEAAGHRAAAAAESNDARLEHSAAKVRS